MLSVIKTLEFERWFAGLRDLGARTRILARLVRIEYGHFGDFKPVGDGVCELRFDFGPGYRVYFQRRGREVVLLLCGGDKGSQGSDIKRAKAIAASLSDEGELK